MNQTPEIAPRPAATATHEARPELSVVIPMFNEADNLRLLVDTLTPVLDRAAGSFEVVFVDDGSSDGTLDALRRANELDPRFRAVSFSRNFGKEIAIAAGLDHAQGAAVVIMDADLQHPPEMIETFVARWREGYENVYGQRVDRTADSALRRMLTMRFYRLFANFGETSLPPGAGDFRLLDRKAVDALRAMPERARFSKGLYAWIGFRSIGVPFEVQERAFGAVQVQLSQADALRARRADVVFDAAAEGVDLRRHDHLHRRAGGGGVSSSSARSPTAPTCRATHR